MKAVPFTGITKFQITTSKPYPKDITQKYPDAYQRQQQAVRNFLLKLQREQGERHPVLIYGSTSPKNITEKVVVDGIDALRMGYEIVYRQQQYEAMIDRNPNCWGMLQAGPQPLTPVQLFDAQTKMHSTLNDRILWKDLRMLATSQVQEEYSKKATRTIDIQA